MTKNPPDLAIKKIITNGNSEFSRSPCFTIYLLCEGRGFVDVDHAEHAFVSPMLLCVNPYQRVVLRTKGEMIRGQALYFHPNYFCIETHHHAVGCNGVLFNEVYERPLVKLDSTSLQELQWYMREIESELSIKDIAHQEVLLSSLKIFLIKASRLKLQQQGFEGLAAINRPEVLRRLRELLEARYTELHSPSAYAHLLGVSTQTLSATVKKHFGKTMSELIRERLMKHARWQLLHTLKSVKEIAHEVGFNDEFYFSRLFKKSLGRSPLVFRKQESEWRNYSNLSMQTIESSIPSSNSRN